jgi:hypothetical protein
MFPYWLGKTLIDVLPIFLAWWVKAGELEDESFPSRVEDPV